MLPVKAVVCSTTSANKKKVENTSYHVGFQQIQSAAARKSAFTEREFRGGIITIKSTADFESPGYYYFLAGKTYNWAFCGLL